MINFRFLLRISHAMSIYQIFYIHNRHERSSLDMICHASSLCNIRVASLHWGAREHGHSSGFIDSRDTRIPLPALSEGKYARLGFIAKGHAVVIIYLPKCVVGKRGILQACQVYYTNAISLTCHNWPTHKTHFKKRLDKWQITNAVWWISQIMQDEYCFMYKTMTVPGWMKTSIHISHLLT